MIDVEIVVEAGRSNAFVMLRFRHFSLSLIGAGQAFFRHPIEQTLDLPTSRERHEFFLTVPAFGAGCHWGPGGDGDETGGGSRITYWINPHDAEETLGPILLYLICLSDDPIAYRDLVDHPRRFCG